MPGTQETGGWKGYSSRAWYRVIWRLSRSAGVGKASHPAFLMSASMVWLTLHPSASATCGTAGQGVNALADAPPL
jgi:hypothetical protein